MAIYSFAFYMVVKKLLAKKFDAHVTMPFILFIAFCFTSIIWSASVSDTTHNLIALVGTILYVLYLINQYNDDEFIQILHKALMLVLVTSIFLAVFFPDLGTYTDPGYSAWRGVYVTKNMLARYLALLFLVSMYTYKHNTNKIKFFITIGMVLLSLYFCKSVTAVVILGLLMLLSTYNKNIKKDTLKILAIFLVVDVLLLYFIPTLNSTNSSILINLDRDFTLSGRNVIWEYSLKAANEKFLLGYGFSAFWSENNPVSQYLIYIINYKTPHSHNGLLDLTLNLGLIGTLLYLTMIIGTIISDIKENRVNNFYYRFMIFLFLYNLTESNIFVPNELFLIIQMFFILYPLKLFNSPTRVAGTTVGS